MVRERVGDWRLAWRFALAGVIAGILVIALSETGLTTATFDAGQDRLQLKGKSAEKFRVLKVTAIREDKIAPWVPMPTEAAMTSYRAKRQLYATQSVFT